MITKSQEFMLRNALKESFRAWERASLLYANSISTSDAEYLTLVKDMREAMERITKQFDAAIQEIKEGKVSETNPCGSTFTG